MLVNRPGESFQLLDFFAVNLDLFIETSENAGFSGVTPQLFDHSSTSVKASLAVL